MLRKLFEQMRSLLRRREADREPLPKNGGDFDHLEELFDRADGADDRYAASGNLGELEQATTTWAALLAHPDFPQTPQAFQLRSFNNASITFAHRYQALGQPADLDRALSLAQAAVDATPATNPDLPGYRNNLGARFSERYARTGALDDLEAAIRETQAAVEATPPTNPNLPGRRTNLGNRFSERYARTGALDDLEAAIRETQAAVDATPPTNPDLPGRRNNLGNRFSERYARTGALDDLEAAIDHYQAALSAYGNSFPIERRLTANNLGALLYQQQDYTAAREAFVLAHAAIQQLAGQALPEAMRRTMSAENALLYARLVVCCLQLGDQEAAFAYASAGKGRAFVDLLASARFDLAAVGADQPELQAELEQARQLRAQIDALLARLTGEAGQARGEASPANRAAEQRTLLNELNTRYTENQAHWAGMAQRYPALTATQRAPNLDAATARRLAQQLAATLVEFFQHDQGWGAFVVTPTAIQHVLLPDLTNKLLQSMRTWVERIGQPSGQNAQSYARLEQWYRAVFAPLVPHLPAGRAVVCAPHGVLHLLPLAAARNPETKAYASEQYQLTLVPSLGALHVVWQQAQRSGMQSRQRPQRLLVAAYPGTPDSAQYLAHVLPEAEAIAGQFASVTPLYAAQATPDAVIAAAPGQEVVHLGCHGFFDYEHPDQSGLLLSGGWLTVQRMISDLKVQQSRLFTMGACVSGRADLTSGDELVGLTQAALTAGAPVVVSSLWTVDDAATRALFSEFYAGVAAGQAPATALRQAQAHIRAQPQWAHPYYWAAFQVSGLIGR